MSKERELLERWLDDTIFEPEELDYLMEETRELLAQPEQEQEPVAWLITATSCGNAQDWKFVSLERKAPERLERMFPVFTPLYTSPPKREPLSTDAMLRLIAEHRDFPLNLARAVERECGIGGEE